MAVISKPLSANERDKAQKAIVTMGQLGVMAQNLHLFADADLLRACVKGDVSKMASALAISSSYSGVVEWLVNPAVGKLADEHGRQWVYFVGPVSSLVTGAAVIATGGTNLQIQIVQRALNWSLISLSNSFIGPITISDLYSGAELGPRIAELFGGYGLAIIAAPMLGGFIQSRFGPMAVFKARLLLSLLQIAWVYKRIPETLLEENKRQFSVADVNPLGFLRLFTKTKTMRVVSTSLFLTALAEGKNMVSMRQSWDVSPLSLSVAEKTASTTVFGALCYISGMYLVRAVTEAAGPRGFTSLANLTNALGLIVSGLPLPSYKISIWLGTLLTALGINNTNAAQMKAYGVEHAVASGFGRGEYGGMYSSLRSSSIVIAPIIYGWAFRRAVAGKSFLGFPWFVAALLGGILPEILHRSLSDQDLKVPAPKA